MRRILLGLVAFVALFAAERPPRAETQVDLELVLAIDISGSIDPDEAKLQRQGYINAFRDPQIIGAIRRGPNGRIAVSYFEWGNYRSNHLVMDWTLIGDAASSNAVADMLTERPIMRGMRTSISGAIEYALGLFERSGAEPLRRVLDISGDGPNNDGGLITIFRDKAAAAGVTINGLAIINNRPGPSGFPPMANLDKYYLGCVITGPGAFVERAENFDDFDRAIRRKLIMEIAGIGKEMAPPGGATRWAAQAPVHPSLRRPVSDYVFELGCDIGERQSRDFWRSRSLN
jgi:hypothetical protein